jgi:hypothetical protein
MTKLALSTRFGLAAVVLAALPSVAGAVRPKVPVPTPAERESATLRKFDRNHNGVIDPFERRRMWAVQYDSTLENYDYNGNGRLETGELAAARTARVEKIILMLDVNRDGRLSFAEARRHGMETPLVEKFWLIDRNNDRLLSKHEILASKYVQYPVVHTRPFWKYWTSA